MALIINRSLTAKIAAALKKPVPTFVREGAPGRRMIYPQAPVTEQEIRSAFDTGDGTVTIGGGTAPGVPLTLAITKWDGSSHTRFLTNDHSDWYNSPNYLWLSMTKTVQTGGTSTLTQTAPMSSDSGSPSTLAVFMSESAEELSLIPDGLVHFRALFTHTSGAAPTKVRVVYGVAHAYNSYTPIAYSDYQSVTGHQSFYITAPLTVIAAGDRIYCAVQCYDTSGTDDVTITYGGTGGGADNNRARLDIPAAISHLPDWITPALADLWDRTGTVLSPATAGDRVSITADSANGALEGIASGANTGVRGVSATGPGLRGSASGGQGVYGTNDGAGPGGKFDGGVTTGNGLEGLVENTNNGYYSVAAIEGTTGAARSLLGEWADFVERASDPADPAAGKGRAYARDDGKIYYRNSAGTEYDLTSGGAGGGYAEVQEEGSAVTARTKLNFVGTALTAADDAPNTRTNVTVAAILNALASLANAAGDLTNDGAGALSWRAKQWTRSGGFIYTATPADAMVMDASAAISFRDADGSGSLDATLKRIAANVLGMDTGDAWRSGVYDEFAETPAPGTPAAGFARIYFKADSRPYCKDSAGNELALSYGGGGTGTGFDFGTGEDGDVDINAAGTFDSGTVITNNVLQRDAYFNNLTLSAGDLDTNQFRLYVKGTLTIGNGFKVHVNGVAGANGGNATLNVPGVVGTATPARGVGTIGVSGTFEPGVAGAGAAGVAVAGNGVKGGNGGSAKSVSNSNMPITGAKGGNGGAGGNCAPNTGGATGTTANGGTCNALSVNNGYPVRSKLGYEQWRYWPTSSGSSPGAFNCAGSPSGGPGGGSGAALVGGTSGAGGAGGAGGQTATGIFAAVNQIVDNNATNIGFQAIGGAGGNGGNGGNAQGTNAGGGGAGGPGAGGHGGVIIIVTNTIGYVVDAAAYAGGAAGSQGTGGTGVGTGANGGTGTAATAGSAGMAIVFSPA